MFKFLFFQCVIIFILDNILKQSATQELPKFNAL